MSNSKTLVKSIINQRKRLLKLNCSAKNTSLCLRYINELSSQIEAFQNKWNEEGWKRFILRNLNKLEYLIPNNKAGLTIKNKLYEI